MRILINGMSASAGAGLTYLYNVVPQLENIPGLKAFVVASKDVLKTLHESSNVTFIEPPSARGAALRFLAEQRTMPQLIRETAADLLLSMGNIALRNAPVPQILLSGNSLYTSDTFFADLRTRGDYRMLVETKIRAWFARRSVHWADVTVAPSEAFAQQLGRWTGKKILALHHGFDPAVFSSDSAPLPAHVQHHLDESRDALKLLFVSHYNYYRNFETLFRALRLVLNRAPETKIKLFVTCKLRPDANPGTYRTQQAAALVENLGLQSTIVQLGAIPYRSLHHLYRACQIYVTPAYTETFAHPLIEAMHSGLPIVASDLPVHQEICRDAAIYFPAFSEDTLAHKILELHGNRSLVDALASHGTLRAQDFSWQQHVQRLLALGERILHSEKRNSRAIEHA